MRKNTPHINLAAGLAALLIAVPAATVATLSLMAAPAPDPALSWADSYEVGELEGFAPTVRRNPPDAVQMAFGEESYRPGSTARLRFWSSVAGVTIRIFRVGTEKIPTIGNEQMQGTPVGAARTVAIVRSGRTLTLRIGHWPTGLYFARATTLDGHLGYAPFVVRPTRLGEHPVAVVMPTRTWQAYNFRDDDGNGEGDTWYANQKHTTVILGRPYLNRGVPPHFRQYDLYFLHWLYKTGRSFDVLSQAELDTATGEQLARAYTAIIFPGHHEYVTTAEYDAIQRYRDLGGNLAFLSANNFFWRIDKAGNVITRVAQWRDLGRPESALIGVMYRGNDSGEHRAPWVARDVAAAPWLFAGTGVASGEPIASCGIEIDRTSSASPRDVRVLADVRDLFGPGYTAQMTYYETKSGARVFAAGAFTLAGSARNPRVQVLLANLWQRLVTEELEGTTL